MAQKSSRVCRLLVAFLLPFDFNVIFSTLYFSYIRNLCDINIRLTEVSGRDVLLGDCKLK